MPQKSTRVSGLSFVWCGLSNCGEYTNVGDHSSATCTSVYAATRRIISQFKADKVGRGTRHGCPSAHPCMQLRQTQSKTCYVPGVPYHTILLSCHPKMCTMSFNFDHTETSPERSRKPREAQTRKPIICVRARFTVLFLTPLCTYCCASGLTSIYPICWL